MSWRQSALVVAIMVASGTFLFWGIQRQLLGIWTGFAIDSRVVATLERSQSDLKQLAADNPVKTEALRSRFEQNQKLINRLRIIEQNRLRIARRYELLLLLAVGASLLLAGSLTVARQHRLTRRLSRLQRSLEELAEGRPDVRVDEKGRDVIAVFARMIERTSAVMASQRQRLNSLKNLQAWQEAARRHVHEIRTPLTVARLELDRLRERLRDQGESTSQAQAIISGIGQELDQLSAFTRQFGSFARLPAPQPQPTDLLGFVREFQGTFANAWSNLRIPGVSAGPPCWAMIDREMIRQVLVNLCENSSRAVGQGGGSVAISVLAEEGSGRVGIEVADDGPGVPEAIRPRLFEPYVTASKIGEGMGLGLAISRKIALDHGGDLDLASSSASGAVFRLILPRGESD